MSAKDENAAHVEHPEHEALLTAAISLAGLFSNCVEAFGLIHPGPKWDKQERLLMTRLGLQQARLLIWGSVLGIVSPPASVTDRAVPRHPSSAYPDLKEPTFFDARDPRLDDPQYRTKIEETLSAIVDRSSGHSREEMMAKFGLKPPKRFGSTYEPAMDTNRLESFREKYELLKEVAESYAAINTRRNNSIIHTSWQIADIIKFAEFIKLTQAKVDYLIELLEVKEKVDRAMRMDIRVFGWHIAPDRVRTAQDISKLRLLQEICRDDYPEYLEATQQALDNISRESRENAIPPAAFRQVEERLNQTENGANGANHAHKKRPGLFKLFSSFGKPKKHEHPVRSQSVSGSSTAQEADAGPPRSQSDAGPTTDSDAPLGRIRSKSVGAYIDPPIIDEDLCNELEKLETQDDTAEVQLSTADPRKEAHDKVAELSSGITRHDQYHGIARTATKDLNQPGGNFSDS